MSSELIVDLVIEKDLVQYELALHTMQKRVMKIINKEANQILWLLEHTPVYTAGSCYKECEILNKNEISLIHTDRGGKITYHGPGQRLIYLMLDLRQIYDVFNIKKFVSDLEDVVINTLDHYMIKAKKKAGMIGVWVNTQHIKKNAKYYKYIEKNQQSQQLGIQLKLNDKNNDESNNDESSESFIQVIDDNYYDKKICAIGIRIKNYITYHGIAINLNLDLKKFENIIPCGISDYGVTSMLEVYPEIFPLNMQIFHDVLLQKICERFQFKLNYINCI